MVHNVLNKLSIFEDWSYIQKVDGMHWVNGTMLKEWIVHDFHDIISHWFVSGLEKLTKTLISHGKAAISGVFLPEVIFLWILHSETQINLYKICGIFLKNSFNVVKGRDEVNESFVRANDELPTLEIERYLHDNLKIIQSRHH